MPSHISKVRLDQLVDEGWLISQVHPTLDLTIYNYSQKTQYESYWTPETLMCRGLVMNSAGKVVARPFGKFFNSSEHAPEEIPELPFEVYEKMDGSLGIFFWYSNESGLYPVFASRGSFTSDQAVKGWEMLQKLPYRELAYGHTHMFEIIYGNTTLELIEITLDDATTLTVSPSFLLMTKRGLLEAQNLLPTDTLILSK